ncbi:MAG: glycosyltransferase family 4 protein [Candidatus Eremiobacteraeota bacterium]|nr:glycosyltransferase family 4 protein [Candidatus Eremiobacteraeota bacterium]
MKVAVDAANLIHDRRGMGRYVRSILAELPGHGIEPILVCRTENDCARVRELGMRLHVCTPVQARAQRVEASWFPWNGMRFDLRVPSVLSVYDLFAFENPHRNIVARFREQRPIARGIAKAQSIATISEWSARQIVERFGVRRSRVTILPPALDPLWQPQPRSRTSQPFVLFVAGPEPRKNAPVLFEAFERSFLKLDIGLTVAGTLSAQDEERLARCNFHHTRVRPTDIELRDLYANALAVAVPSRREGLGLVALEAMACGAAVLAANTAALPEACGGAAWLIDPDDVAEWSRALTTVALDEDQRMIYQQRSVERAITIDRHAPARVMAGLLLALR